RAAIAHAMPRLLLRRIDGLLWSVYRLDLLRESGRDGRSQRSSAARLRRDTTASERNTILFFFAISLQLNCTERATLTHAVLDK
ncbi:MAG TPA: hypothetical protein VNS62_01455, partial [Candidatus Udaeobacter sp.]|nr:hypothetical protein [Candidatus Udaeobacter sp.]